MDLIDDLSARGLIHDSTDLEFLRSRLDEKSIGVYVGFDGGKRVYNQAKTLIEAGMAAGPPVLVDEFCRRERARSGS